MLDAFAGDDRFVNEMPASRRAGTGNARQRSPAVDLAERVLRFTVLGLAIAGSCCFSGCSWRQAYDTAHAWQRNACVRIMDTQERDRCVAGTGMAYDDYRRQTQTDKSDR